MIVLHMLTKDMFLAHFCFYKGAVSVCLGVLIEKKIPNLDPTLDKHHFTYLHGIKQTGENQ